MIKLSGIINTAQRGVRQNKSLVEKSNSLVKCTTSNPATCTRTVSESAHFAHITSHKDVGGNIAIGYPDYYCKLKSKTFVEAQPERTVKFAGRERLIKAIPAHYEYDYELLPHYKIDKLWTTGKGSGTRSVQELVRTSLKDTDTQGRVTLEACCIDGKTAPGGFYYKLGFRFKNPYINQECEEWIKSGGSRETAPFATGEMFLPKENIQHCLDY